MKRFLVFCFCVMAATRAFAQACTTLCPLALGAALTIAQRMGVKDEIVGVLGGAFLAVMGYVFIRLFDRKNWHFKGRNFILILFAVSLVGLMYVNRLTYKPALHWNLLYIDSFLLATLCGAAAHIFGVHLYTWMKMKNGGHAHFPFEKVVIPLLVDAIVVWLFWGTSLCECQEVLILN